MIDTKVARAVHALEQHRSFRIASEAIGTSQSTFSRHIAQAESLAGQTLFERTGKGIAPTPAGRSFLTLLKSLEEAMGQFEASSDRLRQSGPDILNIGCGPLAARSVVGPLLSETFAERPEIRSKICVTSSKDPLDALRTGALDLVVCDLTHTADIRSLEIQMLRKQEVTFWARRQHPLHARQSASISDIFSYPFATCQLPKYWQNQIATMLGGTKSAIETASRAPHIESEDFSMLASIACEQDLICAGMEVDFHHFCRLGLLKKISTKEPMAWNLCVARREGASFPALDMFWSKLNSKFVEV